MISIDFNKLIHSVTYYLSYQDRIGRDFMINEFSLKYPVADYLTGLEMPLTNIQLEFPHPTFKKRQIDLVTTDNSKKKIENVFEFKMAKLDTRYEPEQKRIFNDLMRLHLIAKANASSCYFVIVGTAEEFLQCFRSTIPKKLASQTIDKDDLPLPNGFYTEWFKFNVNDEKTFDVKNVSKNDYDKIYKAFLQDYKPKKRGEILILPDQITTKCIAISALSREFPTPYVGGIWKIE